ncbi:uncharacterized protein Hap1MRO34_022248 isoform 2-T2 [Clarias gariepinus]|uniref:uncharacterized protein LOC128508339 isoform X2 n=1 Tax=Clarias gariepinus TaxID=13013 RepID=UPI00234D7C4A|nr:uncharacterized protein LOC128508339 isoform X2 [Clarias gariepinus]
MTMPDLRTKLEAPSPAPTDMSFKSEQSMDPPFGFHKRTKLEAPSPAPTDMSFKSKQSMDPPFGFHKRNVVQERFTSPAPSYFSVRPVAFIEGNVRTKFAAPSPAPTGVSFQSEQSMDPLVGFQNGVSCPSPIMEDCLRCPKCSDVLKDPVSIPCGHSFCKTCIQSYWTKPANEESYSCPQCKKRFKNRPALNLNVALNQMLKQAKFSPALPAQSYTGPGDVACDICTGSKIRAVKWCLTCNVAYCETHVRQHYTVGALQRHTLRDMMGDPETRSCQLHYRGLEVFCRTDQVFICLVCAMEEHKGHDTVLAKTEVQDAEFSSLTESRMKDEVQHNNADLAMEDRLQRAEAFLSYLTQLFCRRLEDSSIFGFELVEVAALSRDLDLGMLYDCRSDLFSSDVLLWEKNIVSSTRLSITRPHKDVRILDGDSLHDRLTALDLTLPLRASVISGLVKIAGASAFFNHNIQSQLQDRVTLHYRTSTRLDMLNHELLHDGFPPSVTGLTSATHVVVAVLYGSQAFFVFDSKKDRRAENADLKDVAKKLINSSSQTDLLSRLSEQDKSALCHCAAFIDGNCVQNPVDFETTVRLYNSFQNAKKEVPLKVWLYPLKNLDQTSACVVRHVTKDQLYKAEKVLEHLGRQVNFCHHMMSVFNSYDIFKQFSALKDALCNFFSLLQQYQCNFQKRLASCIKITREKGEGGLQELLETNAKSPFGLVKTYQWLQNKSTEMRALIQCSSANVTIIKGQKDFQHYVQDCQADRLLCFILTSVDNVEDPFLSALAQYIKSMNTVITTKMRHAVEVSGTSQKILSDLESFLLNKESNANTQETVFVAASVPDPCSPGSAVHFYQSGSSLSLNAKLEVKLESAEIIAVDQTRVTMKLQSAEGYRVEYRVAKKDRKWRVISCTRESCVVSGLTPGTHYELRYALTDSKGMSNYSGITEFQTVSRVRPGAPTVLKLNKEEICIAWEKAEEDDDDEDSLVLYYRVEYLEAGLEGWQSIQTDGPVCECTITLPDSTCYRARVCAVYANGDTSAPSEDSEIPVHVWNINLSERRASLLLDLLKSQNVKEPLEITDFTEEEGEVQSFLQCLHWISELRVSFNVLVRMAHALEKIKPCGPMTLEGALKQPLKELSIVQKSPQQAEEVSSRVQSSLVSLLRLWKIDCLNLTECTMEAQLYTFLINQQSPVSIRFPKETLQKLIAMVYEVRDAEFTSCFLQKICGDLTSCFVTWNIIHYFLQHHTLTVDLRNSPIGQEDIRELLPLLDRIKLKRLNSSFIMAVMSAICETGSAHSVSSLLNLSENCVNLENRELSFADCAALRFTLEHCTGVSLNFLWSSLPEGELERIIPLLSHVAHLRVDRKLLLKLLHCCNVPELHQEAAVLLSALHHRLDFSCYDALDLTADTTTYSLGIEDCKVICKTIQKAHEHVLLILHDCEIEDAGVEQLYPIRNKITLSCSNALLHKFSPSAPVEPELKSVAQESEVDLGPGPVEQWHWFWNVLKSCQE